MNTSKPIELLEHLRLTNIGVQPGSISFQTVTLESDRFICVREKVNGQEQNQLVIVDLADADDVIRRPIAADSAIMHPKQKLLALRAQRVLQIFDLETEAKVMSHIMNDVVVFWKWVSETVIGLVTDWSVYHWTIADEMLPPPQKMFDLDDSLRGVQIIDYRITPEEDWFVLIGLIRNSINSAVFKVEGAMQLYSTTRNVSQAIEGHAAAFAELKLDGGESPTKLFTWAARTVSGAKLHIFEIDHNAANPAFRNKAIDMYFPPEAINDFTVSMQISKRHGIIYLVTQHGFIHLYDLETGACVYMRRISGETIFATAQHEATDGIIGVNRTGQVLSVNVDDQTIVPYILTTLNNVELAFKLARRANLPVSDNLYVRHYQWLLQSGQFEEGAQITASAPTDILRPVSAIEVSERATAEPEAFSSYLQNLSSLDLNAPERSSDEIINQTQPIGSTTSDSKASAPLHTASNLNRSLPPLSQLESNVSMTSSLPPVNMDYQTAFSTTSPQCLDGRIARLGQHPEASGGYADVWKGSLNTVPVAIKVTRPFETNGGRIDKHRLLKRLWREFLSWSCLSHPNVIACLGFSSDFSPMPGVPSLISPWMVNGTVLSCLGQHTESSRLKLLLGIAEGLSYLHHRQPVIVHGDLRAGNVLVSETGIPCLTDFGLSKILSDTRGMTTSSEVAGSLRWMSPELLRADGENLSVYSDVWAYAMTVLEILTGNRPYHEFRSDAVVFGQIISGQLPLRPANDGVSILIKDEIWAICRQCWEQKAPDRPSMRAVTSKLTAVHI